MTDLERAKSLLTGKRTLAVVKGAWSMTSEERGIAPLYSLFRSFSSDLAKGGAAADRVVGKAAALLYVLLGVKAVHAGVVSDLAIEVFRTHSIILTYDVRTERIKNRAGDGFCPMESLVEGIDDPEEALEVIGKKLAEFSQRCN